jgi:AcrR family transcriptional regulator
MVTEARRDRRAERHEATRREILRAAWLLADQRGLTGWPLKDLADAVGMRAPSLYGYFDSKAALFDALFADGYRALLDHVDQMSAAGSPQEVLHDGARLFFDFCVSDTARFQLLFLRTIPGFVPSETSYALAGEVLERLQAVLVAAGIGDEASVDLYTALLTGMASQQISNDPDGDRWRRLLDDAVDLLLARAASA